MALAQQRRWKRSGGGAVGAVAVLRQRRWQCGSRAVAIARRQLILEPWWIQESTQRCRIAGCCSIPTQLWAQLEVLGSVEASHFTT